MLENVELNKLSDAYFGDVEPDAQALAICLEKYSVFKFLSTESALLLARNELLYFDSKALVNQPKPSEFVLKQISLRSSLIMTLWFGLFELTSLCYHVFDSIDKDYSVKSEHKL